MIARRLAAPFYLLDHRRAAISSARKMAAFVLGSLDIDDEVHRASKGKPSNSAEREISFHDRLFRACGEDGWSHRENLG
jgi:hypothetical protein